VDRFGQYTRREWPGKVKSEADLKIQLGFMRNDRTLWEHFSWTAAEAAKAGAQYCDVISFNTAIG
jgi:hypothetical protein